MSNRTLATRYFMQTHNDFDSARRELYKMGIKTSYSEDVVIFSTLLTSKNSLDNPYTQECNGLILSRPDYKILVVPTRTLRFNIATETSNAFLHQGLYHVYNALDGTCFNMYYNDKWMISTAKGHSMNDIKWDTKTYQEIIEECLTAIGYTWETFTAALDKNKCYSFGFKHSSFHKFFGGNEPTSKLWFIQSVVTDESSDRYLWASDQSPIEIIPNQERYTTVVSNLRDLYKKAGAALEDFLTNKNVCYGFILRSVNINVTKSHSDLFIESSLMRTIRQFWYENDLIDMCHKNKWNKELAITLNAFLGRSENDTFLKLFPQYQSWFDKHEILVKKISENMTKLAFKEPIDDSAIATVSREMYTSFVENIEFDISGKTKEAVSKVYLEYVSHPDSLSILMQVA